MSISIEEKMLFNLELSEKSGVPVLFLSHPGCGKTTIVSKYAKHKGYKLTTVIGSQKTREDILGVMVVKDGNVTTTPPDWYKEVVRNSENGEKTILFFDELSTTSPDIQGALLDLFFNRKVGGFDKDGNANSLPEDCFIVASANYKSNLPGYFDIISPTLNRFMIINLEYSSTRNLLDEFFNDGTHGLKSSSLMGDIEYKEIGEKAQESMMTSLKRTLTRLFPSMGELSQMNLSSMYSTDGGIYNFVSGRTISYVVRIANCLQQMTQSLLRTRDLSEYTDLVWSSFSGLVGLPADFTELDSKQIEIHALSIGTSISQVIYESCTTEFKEAPKAIDGDFNLGNFTQQLNYINNNKDTLFDSIEASIKMTENIKAFVDIVLEGSKPISVGGLKTIIKLSKELDELSLPKANTFVDSAYVKELSELSKMAQTLEINLHNLLKKDKRETVQFSEVYNY